MDLAILIEESGVTNRGDAGHISGRFLPVDCGYRRDKDEGTAATTGLPSRRAMKGPLAEQFGNARASKSSSIEELLKFGTAKAVTE
jgi:hypothetical protein